ncbi:MAG: alpha/beta hydrolase [Rhodospirillales bacterium]|nr:MAG: alpha/beta hydrolase [Rhodospirillales bacterium]
MAITVYFATNRHNEGTEKKPEFGRNFSEKGLTYLRFGSAEVEAPARAGGRYRVSSVYLAPEHVIDDPDAPKKEKSKEKFGSREIFDDLRESMIEHKSDALVLIHGFACKFEESLERAAQIKDVYQLDERPLEVFVFSWPADGDMIPLVSYNRDRDDARASGPAIQRALTILMRYLVAIGDRAHCKQNLHLVAHSMGNYALRHAVQAICGEHGANRLPRLFKNVFLMAADEDNDAFEHAHKFAPLAALTDTIHVYYAAEDGALKISRDTKNAQDRLGATGPRTLSDLPMKVSLVDCAEVLETVFSDRGHQYYRNRPEVVADVRQVLRGVPSDEILGREFIPEKRSYRLKPA